MVCQSFCVGILLSETHRHVSRTVTRSLRPPPQSFTQLLPDAGQLSFGFILYFRFSIRPGDTRPNPSTLLIQRKNINDLCILNMCILLMCFLSGAVVSHGSVVIVPWGWSFLSCDPRAVYVLW